MPQRSRHPHPGDRVIEILNIDLEEELVVWVRMQGRYMTALLKWYM